MKKLIVLVTQLSLQLLELDPRWCYYFLSRRVIREKKWRIPKRGKEKKGFSILARSLNGKKSFGRSGNYSTILYDRSYWYCISRRTIMRIAQGPRALQSINQSNE